MKTINGYTRLQFVAFLRHTLIPDLQAADMDGMAEDFETALQFITDDVEILHDTRKALHAVTGAVPAGSNAETLCRNSLKEIDTALDSPALAKIAAGNPARRKCTCLENNPHLSDR